VQLEEEEGEGARSFMSTGGSSSSSMLGRGGARDSAVSWSAFGFRFFLGWIEPGKIPDMFGSREGERRDVVRRKLGNLASLARSRPLFVHKSFQIIDEPCQRTRERCVDQRDLRGEFAMDDLLAWVFISSHLFA
jgi:hypothetical protein